MVRPAGRYFFLPGIAVAFCIPAVAKTFGCSFLGFLASLFFLIWPFAIAILPLAAGRSGDRPES